MDFPCYNDNITMDVGARISMSLLRFFFFYTSRYDQQATECVSSTRYPDDKSFETLFRFFFNYFIFLRFLTLKGVFSSHLNGNVLTRFQLYEIKINSLKLMC